MLLGLPTVLQGYITAYLLAKAPYEPQESSINFHLRHQHAVTGDSKVVFADFNPSASFSGGETQFSIVTQPSKVPRPKSHADFMTAQRGHRLGISSNLAWNDWDVPTPDVTKRSTLLQLAKMAANTYGPDNTTYGEWYDIEGWDSNPHGWNPGDDGLRGHIFVSDDNSTVVIGIKGTSAGWLVGGGGPTVSKDKLNDNLLFSCCCARVGPTWSTVCGCYDGGYRCDSNCVEDALKDDGLFYPMGLNLYNNVSYLYPNANIWLTGHSLGGSLASLTGVTFGAPVVAFEAPADRMAWQRLHLPIPPSSKHITHVYNTADPIPQGTCTGVASTCGIGGFALESKCHIGQVILYDTVRKLGWSVDIRSHGIKVIVDRLLSDNADWKPEFNGEPEKSEQGGLFNIFHWGWPGRRGDKPEDSDEPDRKYPEVPLARPALEVEGVDGVCTDCYSWEYGNFKNQSARSAKPGGCH